MAARKPKLAVWKFASCDGCQLSLLDCEDELLTVADAVDIAYFPEATSRMAPGPYELSLVEGSVTTPHDLKRIQSIRRQSRFLVTIGACATAGGIQALRNAADVNEFAAHVYPKPQYLKTLATSTPISAHVKVDFELHGCPIDKHQLLEVIGAFLQGAHAEHSGGIRLHAVQARRHRLRDGRSWHALPGAGHAGRLRRASARAIIAAATAASVRSPTRRPLRSPRTWPPAAPVSANARCTGCSAPSTRRRRNSTREARRP